jgi:hypothetical protein
LSSQWVVVVNPFLICLFENEGTEEPCWFFFVGRQSTYRRVSTERTLLVPAADGNFFSKSEKVLR